MIRISESLMGFEADSPKGTLYSYLLLRASGNFLFNHIPDAIFWKKNLPELKRAGGVKWSLLTHAGDADEGSKVLHDALGMELVAEEYEGLKARRKCKVPIAKFIRPGERIDKDVASIAAPGHCPTFMCYDIRVDGKSFMVTSDMFLRKSETRWVVKVPERNAVVARDSIDRIFSSGFRYWLPGICAKGVHNFAAMTGKEKTALRATLKDSLRKRYPDAF